MQTRDAKKKKGLNQRELEGRARNCSILEKIFLGEEK
jgi:hypothetical protein